MEEKLSAKYYSPEGYWRGKTAITKLSTATKLPVKVVKDWLAHQAIWQIYLPAPKVIRRPIFDETHPNYVHQADLLFLPHDKVKRKTFKYALTVVDVASRYKDAEALTDKTANSVANALSLIYARGPLTWPKLLQVDPGREFFSDVTSLLNKHGVQIRRGVVGVHRNQAIVERFNRTLAERLFGHQYYKELEMSEKLSVRNKEWVVRLPAVVKAINNEETRLISQKPADAIKLETVKQPTSKLSKIPILPHNAFVRYLYEKGELEGGTVRRATDPIWSVKIYMIGNIVQKLGQPTLYYLLDGPKRSFVREELQVVPRPEE